MVTFNDLLKYMSSPSYAGKNFENLMHVFSCDNISLVKEISHLEKQGLIFKAKSGDYFLCSRFNLVKGEITKVFRDFALAKYQINNEVKEVRIEDYELKGAYCYDECLLNIIDEDSAAVFRILKRNERNIVGEFHKGKFDYVVPDDINLEYRIKIKENSEAVEGSKVLVNIIDYNKEIVGKIVKVLGHKDDPGVDITSLAYEFNASVEFSKEIIEEANRLNKPFTNKDLENRYDFRNHLICTIDGKDAKDLDDAVEVVKLDNSNYSLGVHIADVSHYVKEDSLLDNEAFNRGTSIYMVNSVIPMLPHVLSNGICSLNPNEDRLSLSCVMEINKEGKVVNYQIGPSIIKSSYRLNYDDVNAFFANKFSYDLPLEKMLLAMKELSDILSKAKKLRGAIELDTKEPKFSLNDKGRVIAIETRKTGVGEQIIEDFMVIANEVTSLDIASKKLPYIYRIHDKPKRERLTSLQTQLKPFGHSLILKDNEVNPKDLQDLIDRLKDKKEGNVVSTLVLRSFAKAIYASVNIGHFGLGSKCYSHFTSPIRRYPDLLVHRLHKLYASSNDIDKDAMLRKLTYIAAQCSENEKKAIELERAADDMKMAEYMLDHIDEVYDGIVSGVISNGFFVELDNLVEGMVRFESMNDYFIFDPDTLSATGETSNMRIRLGDKIRVKVKKADKKQRQVEFSFVKKLK